MTASGQKPDFAQVDAGLKDFQRRTVEYVFARLYTDPDRRRRFLIADEVGLGKTLVARGLIARVITKLWDDGVERIDIVYICSNADIARQNIARLRVTAGNDFVLPSRITLLPLFIQDLKRNRINFVSFTPATSFDLKSSMGTVEERVLLYWLLKDAWNLEGAGPLNVFQGNAGAERFRERVKSCRDQSIDPSLRTAFVEVVAIRQELRERFEVLREQFGRQRIHIPREETDARARLMGELRSTLAQTCLRALEPDLVILDEFQRFKHLLAGEDEAGQLARGLFGYSEGNEETRVLLLSATPYKMYTTPDEAGDEDHYADFLLTLEFLLDDRAALREFHGLVGEYRRALYRIADEGAGPLVQTRRELEARLRRVMVRTERLAVAEDRNGMLTEFSNRRPALEASDLEDYVALQRVARVLGHSDTIEYWKSAPYLLNFMDQYQLKEDLEVAQDASEELPALVDALASGGTALLPFRDVETYARIDPANSKLRLLFEDTLDRGVWRLLWIPPSLLYYEPAGPFSDPTLRDVTKRLIFSSWRVVPKVIATLCSYEAERLMFRSLEEKTENTADARERRKPLLRFARDEARLTGLPILSMLYPSVALAAECDPLALCQGLRPPLKIVLANAIARVAALLARLPAEPKGTEDESWYWAAPVLLDLARDRESTRAWLSQERIHTVWTGDVEQDPDAIDTAFAAHVEQLRAVADGKVTLGARPADLAEVLARAAIAAPAVSALRALSRTQCGPGPFPSQAVRNGAARIAWSFVSLFNLPEVTALLRGMNRDEPYWRRVLDYCVDGCLQSVLDEYAHVLQEALGLLDRQDGAAATIAEVIAGAVTLRTASLSVSDVTVDPEKKTFANEPKRMRARFAVRFGEEAVEGGGDVRTRADQTRAAFNSPFWPFVLASTSIGQEGLDFHLYCHAIVHWNLPSNPVDLEQREGRVHRYKGHAVRKNLALRHGATVLASRAPDPWSALFDAGRSDHSGTDIVPFWVYPVPGGARIERHVPAIPLSADLDRLIALRRALVLYRMVFGQARQEDLLSYLQSRLPADRLAELLTELRIDLSPPESHNVRDVPR